jgi:maltooligosyltrehalose trehalohydrolase
MTLRLIASDGDTDVAMQSAAGGYFTATVADLADPPTYRFVLPDGAALADPASRWQPDGVSGPSRGVDPGEFGWTDDGFQPAPLSDLIIYELHVGTFSVAGTFDSAIEHLDELVDLGVNAVEPMPINAFPGERNWGYDGAFPYATQDSYGGPAGFQRFVDACHARGLAVVLDVVYNHLGPEGTVLGSFAPYFTDVYRTPWGAAVNVSEAGSDEVRRYFIDNASMWVRDFHVDALRFDAVHGIVDPTASPFLRELTTALTTLAADLGRAVHLIAESADNNPLVVSSPALGGQGFTAQWNDDFHHALHAILTDERDGYYQDYGRHEQLAVAMTDGFVFRGEFSGFRGRRHGVDSANLPSDRLVVFAQNHDQVGNRAGAERLSSIVGLPKAGLAAAVVLLSPFVPLLFMGEEYAELAPFPYFVDHSDRDLLDAVRKGRAQEFGRDADLMDPAEMATFTSAKLDRTCRGADGDAMRATYQRLIRARREHAVISDPSALESTASTADGLLTLQRRTRLDAMHAVFNFTDQEISAEIPVAFRSHAEVFTSRTTDDGHFSIAAHGYALFVDEDVAP